MNKEVLYSGLRTWAIIVIVHTMCIVMLGALINYYQVTWYDVVQVTVVPILFGIMRICCFDDEEIFEEK